jgi:4-amino-4-deoxy-L-arabinose transferase-like glycosyltransferase
MRSSAPRKIAPTTAPDEAAGFWQVALYAVVGLTLLRLAFLRISPLEFDSAEATRWLWSRTLALGYDGAAPVPVWLTAAGSSFCGPGEACARAVSPLLQAGTAILLGAAGIALGSWRLGAWTMLTYATLPGVAIASIWLGADSPLMFFWALTLYAVLRLRQGGAIGWAVLGGLAAGLGALSSAAMLLFPLGVALYLLLSRGSAPAIARRPLALMAALLLLVLLPHLFWRLGHGAILPPPAPGAIGPSLLSFLLWQIVVFGPLPLYFLLRSAAGGTEGAPITRDDRRLLLCLSLPVLLASLLASLAAGPAPAALAYDPGPAAVASVAAALLVAGRALRGRALAWLKASVVAQGAIGLALYGLIWATPHWHGAPRPLAQAVARLSGWHALGRAVAAELTRQLPPPQLLIDRGVPASLVLYYAAVPPGGYVPWPDDPEGLGGGTAALRPQAPGPFLLVSPAGRESEIAAHFTEVQSVGSIVIPLFTGELRRFDLDRLGGFRGGEP